MAAIPIEAVELSHVYPGGVHALKPTSLQVQAGEVLGVVGQNGSGKTTLVKHFNGLLRPTSGKLLVMGEDSAGKPVYELAKRVGYVFQNPNHQLFSTTVRAELQFGPTNLGLPPDDVQKRVDDAIAFFDLAALLERHPYRLA